jgi:hypothetical protein
MSTIEPNGATLRPFFAVTDEDTGLHFRWRGGAYIEVHPCENTDAVEVIGVWDYEAGTPAIPVTLDAFAVRCSEWMREQDEDE